MFHELAAIFGQGPSGDLAETSQPSISEYSQPRVPISLNLVMFKMKMSPDFFDEHCPHLFKPCFC